mmetsp:Transcript_34667/g.80919  ORF Transcript_34667/g.80919 Transcript_34667/m.80919 type:complete len:263 (-) Transcript_34667:25-813(-)
MAATPLEFYGQYVKRQQLDEQFSEDVRRVIHGGAGGAQPPSSSTPSSAKRASSPGLRAGAALALGGPSTTAASDAHADARAARLQAVEHSRRRECPFDDHTAFQAGGSRPPKSNSAHDNDWAIAGQASRADCRHNRDMQRKIGAGAPFDAPEASWLDQGSRAPASNVAAYADSKAEAVFNKNRMQGTKDLIASDYPQGQSRGASNLPPRPGPLLPEAQLKVVQGGGKLSSLESGQVEYLNSRVLMEANRVRNEGCMKATLAP